MADDNIKAKGDCLSEPFIVASDWRFHVPSLENWFDSYPEMRAAIERKQTAVAKAGRKKIAAVVLDDNGEEVTITGINAGNGYLTTTPKRQTAEWRGFTCYPVSDVAREAIKERNRLADESARIRKVLESLALPVSDRNYSVEQYGDRLEFIEKTVAKETKEAQKKTLAGELKRFANVKRPKFD